MRLVVKAIWVDFVLFTFTLHCSSHWKVLRRKRLVDGVEENYERYESLCGRGAGQNSNRAIAESKSR